MALSCPVLLSSHTWTSTGVNRLKSRKRALANTPVVLPGGPGTASEVQLILRYQKPVIAFLQEREQMPSELRVELKWNRVNEFIHEQVFKGQ